MELKKGIPVSPGIVIGEAFVLDTEEIRIPQRFIEQDQVESEAERFEAAIRQANRSLTQEIDRVDPNLGVVSQILEIHKQLLGDPVLLNEILDGIREKQYTAEHSVSRVINRYIKKFKAMDSPMLAERIHDLFDIERLVLNTLLGGRVETLQSLEQQVVVIARNLTPAQTASLDPRYVTAFATDVGGKTSHTAIMARALGIPAVVALESVSTSVVGGDMIVIDGFRGVVIIGPDDRTLEQYRSRADQAEKVSRKLRKLAKLPSQTYDGYEIELQANIELPQEVHSAVDLGASGIGLYRTEFIHLQAPRPDEELHFKHYQAVLRDLGDRPLTLRTLDLGGDKTPSEFGPGEENPFLGCRSIRWCFEHPDVFRAQLRAIYRASLLGRIRVMLPMIGSVSELERALLVIDQVKRELRDEGIGFDETVPVGIMVEVPSAAVIGDLLGPRSDFFSVGTNDLVQYVLAVDRGNEHVAELYDPAHPAVIRMLLEIMKSGRAAQDPVSLCGEMGAEPLYLPLLIGLGFRSFSVSPQLIPEVKQVIRALSVRQTRSLAQKCLELTDGHAIASELAQWNRKNLPGVGYQWT